MTDASSEPIAEEDRRNRGAGLLAAQSTATNDSVALVEEATTTSDSANGESNSEGLVSSHGAGKLSSPDVDTTVVTPSATRQIISRWQQFPGPARRLVLWAGVVLISGFLLRAGDAVQPAFVSPQERFEKFAETVKQRLPAILYGRDTFGEPLLPVEVNWEMIRAANASGPLKATLTFEDASFGEAGHVMYTRYKIDYQWQRDHWQCQNLKCDVERPELTKLDQMDFNAVLAHESANKNLELVKLKRAQAEALLKPTLPLGELLRSANLY